MRPGVRYFWRHFPQQLEEWPLLTVLLSVSAQGGKKQQNHDYGVKGKPKDPEASDLVEKDKQRGGWDGNCSHYLQGCGLGTLSQGFQEASASPLPLWGEERGRLVGYGWFTE